MSDTHSFDVDVAMEVGVNAAILLQSIKWWCLKNKANERHFHDGLYWSYNSTKAFVEMYPYLGKKAIDNALKKLEGLGYIAVGNYNKNAYDRTKWYAITQSGLALFGESVAPKGEMHFPKGEMEESQRGNGDSQKGKPIPDTNQLPITDKEPDTMCEVPYEDVVGYLNERSGKHYRLVESTKRLIRARASDGYSVDDFRTVIDNKCSEWLGTDMERYIRPSTLFSPQHFEAYLNEKRRSRIDRSGYSVQYEEYSPEGGGSGGFEDIDY